MYKLPDDAIEEFRALWKKHCGYELPPEDAALKAEETFRVLRMLWEPLPQEKPRPDTRHDSTEYLERMRLTVSMDSETDQKPN